MAQLFDSPVIRDIRFANRVFVSPMCQYSNSDGYANDWFLVHLAGTSEFIVEAGVLTVPGEKLLRN
jgi:2,4-dienoyl-CoA reductase-like NADH-dependent reductase (Old Yellow Enzyme family)